MKLTGRRNEYKFGRGHRVSGVCNKGIYLYGFTKKSIVLDQVETENARFGKGGKFNPLFRKIAANKGCALIKGDFSKGNEKRTIVFLVCHNSSDNVTRNKVDFDKCVELVKRFKESKPNAACFMLGDFNPRTQSNDPKKWIKAKKAPRFMNCRGKDWIWSPTLIEAINRLIENYNPSDPTQPSDVSTIYPVRVEGTTTANRIEKETAVLTRIREAFAEKYEAYKNRDPKNTNMKDYA